MNRQEFLERLRILLGDLSEEERERPSSIMKIILRMQDRRWKSRL